MFARLLLASALGTALVTLSATANAQSSDSGRVDLTQSDRIGGLNAASAASGEGLSLTDPAEARGRRPPPPPPKPCHHGHCPRSKH
jgi:hypothetical protein